MGPLLLSAAAPLCLSQAEQELRVAQTEFDRQAEVTRLLLEGISSTHVSPALCCPSVVHHLPGPAPGPPLNSSTRGQTMNLDLRSRWRGAVLEPRVLRVELQLWSKCQRLRSPPCPAGSRWLGAKGGVLKAGVCGQAGDRERLVGQAASQASTALPASPPSAGESSSLPP